VHRRFEWLYVYGFVRPATGATWWCLLPTVRAEAFALALAEFARDEGIDAEHRAVLVLDNAGWHTAKTLVLPDGIDPVFLPAYSPELQPAERLWGLVDEAVANRVVADRTELEQRLIDRCRVLRADHRKAIKARTRYRWWPHERRPQKTP
jgi:transposase